MRGLKPFLTSQSGAILAEFAMLLPVMVLVFGVVIEGARLFWAYQATHAGVRDAARYVARVSNRDICDTGGSLGVSGATLQGLVANAKDGTALFSSGISILSVTPTYTCIDSGLRGGRTAIATVTAQMEITFPLAAIFSLANTSYGTLSTSISDQARILGT